MIPGIVAQVGAGQGAGLQERWWRIRFANNNAGNAAGNGSDAYIDIYQAGLYTEIGGPNLIATAIAFAGQPSNNPPGPLLASYNGSIRWNNAGNQALLQDCFIAFKLNTPDDVVRFAVQGGGTYGPFDVVLESSWDGVTWEFEYGYARIPGSGLQILDRQNIDWTTATYRDWLFQPFEIYNYTNLGIMEMELAETIGGPDLCTGGTPRSTNNGTYPASNLTDNNLGSLCGSLGHGRKAYIGYTFATPVKINEWRIYPLPSERPNSGAVCVGLGTPGTFSGPWYMKQVFEGIWQGNSAVEWANLDCRNPKQPVSPNGPHRYWRIRPESNNLRGGEQAFCVSALDWRKEGASIVGSGTPIAMNWYDANYVPAYAYDGNDNTAWHSNNVNKRTYIGYDFGTPVLPDEFRMKTRNDPIFNQLPVQFAVEFSDDGHNWHMKKGFATPAPSAALQTLTFALA